MKLAQSAVLLVFLLPTAAPAQKKTKKPIVPAAFNQAQYVYVEAVDGGEFDPRLYPEDRQAIADVQAALQDWKRYVLTTRREDADLVIVVRKGRVAEAKGGVVVGTGSGPQGNPSPGQPRGPAGAGVGVVAGGEVGTPDDLFEIFQRSADSTLGALLWMRTLPGGLDTPQVLLFKQFKDAVERTYPSQPSSQTKKP
jgi:hypothetical protein